VNETIEIWAKAALALVALAVVLWRHRLGTRLPERRAGQLLGLVAVLAVVAYYNAGVFHGHRFAHHWEQFHYFLGSKYFPELGYDGLYQASIAAQLESNPLLPVQEHVRDLRANTVVPFESTAKHRADVRRRFSPERWQAFVRDNRFFLEWNDLEYLRQIRTDHGYNPTPTWTFVARLFDRFVPASNRAMTLLGMLDPLLLAVMFWTIFRTYGGRVGCLAVIVWGLGYPWRFYWVGGALLRHDWLAAVVIAVCMLKRERYATAGALLAYATMVRIFPAAFLLGPAVLAIRGLLRKENLRWAGRFAAGFALSVVVCLTAGALSGRGVRAWGEFGRNLEKHRGTWLTNNVGLKNLVLYGPDTLQRTLVNWSLPEPWQPWHAAMDRLQAQRQVWIWLASALLLGLTAAAAWRAPRDEALVIGIAAVFAVTVLTCYYWAMLLLLALRRNLVGVVGVLALNLALFPIDRASPAWEMTYGIMSWALAALFLLWLLPDALTTLRELLARRSPHAELGPASPPPSKRQRPRVSGRA
jgi:hypothetical protein